MRKTFCLSSFFLTAAICHLYFTLNILYIIIEELKDLTKWRRFLIHALKILYKKPCVIWWELLTIIIIKYTYHHDHRLLFCSFMNEHEHIAYYNTYYNDQNLLLLLLLLITMCNSFFLSIFSYIYSWLGNGNNKTYTQCYWLTKSLSWLFLLIIIRYDIMMMRIWKWLEKMMYYYVVIIIIKSSK